MLGSNLVRTDTNCSGHTSLTVQCRDLDMLTLSLKKNSSSIFIFCPVLWFVGPFCQPNITVRNLNLFGYMRYSCVHVQSCAIRLIDKKF